MTIHERIVNLVESNHGIKGTLLGATLAAEFLELVPNDIEQAISECVQSRSIERIEYSVPPERWHIRVIYLPAGSMII